jgi:hypothetical protein
MLKSENLSGLASYPTARTNLGLGTTSTPTFKNLVISTGSIATSAPVTISQTWNAAGQTFKALVVNAAGSSAANSASGSLLLDLQTGGASQFEVDKTGKLRMGATGVNTHGTRSAPALKFASNNCGFYTNAANGYLNFAGSGTSPLVFAPQGLMFSAGASLQWTSGVNDPLDSSTIELALLRDGAANTLALRNGAAAQTFRVYRSYLNAGVDYERLSISHDGVQFGIGSERGGSGVAQPLRIYGGSSAAFDFANGVSFRNASGGTTFMTVASTGNVGIGTTAPAAKLEVVGASSDILSLKNAAQSVFLVTSAGGAGSVQISHANSPSLVINQSSGNKITLGVGSNNLQSSTASNVPVDLIIQGSGGNVGIGTTAPSSKLHVAETWNASGTAFTAAKIVVTDTASAAASNLLELWSGSTPALKSYVAKAGSFVGGVVGPANPPALAFPDSGSYSVGIYSPTSYKIQFGMTSLGPGGAPSAAYLGLQYEMTGGVLSWGLTAQDIVLARDAANTLALRNGAAAQTFNVYGTYSSGTSYERLTLSAPTSANAIIGTNKGSGGGTARGLEIQTDGVTRLTIAAGGAMTASVALTCSQVTVGAGAYLFHGGQTAIGSSGNGRHVFFDGGGTFYDRLQIGGTSASFPAIKRVGAELQIVIASTSSAAGVAAGDADMTFIEDRFRRKGAGSPEGVVTAPIGAVYHNTTGGAGTSFYVKESGTGNTGWVGK